MDCTDVEASTWGEIVLVSFAAVKDAVTAMIETASINFHILRLPTRLVGADQTLPNTNDSVARRRFVNHSKYWYRRHRAPPPAAQEVDHRHRGDSPWFTDSYGGG